MKTYIAPAVAVLLAIVVGLAPAQNSPGSSVEAGPVYNGVEISVDLPPDQHIKNIGSRLDGAGMCVFSSIEMAARAQGLEQMRGWRDWCAENYAGGGYPSKVDKLLAAWWQHKKLQPIPYLQYEGQKPEPLMELIDRTGRMACVTYGWSPRYGSRIAHMVCAPMYGSGGSDLATVLDNNFVAKRAGDGWDESKTYEWMPRAELVRRMKLTGGSAWIFVWLTPGPPRAPVAR